MNVTTVIKHTEKEIFSKAIEIAFFELRHNKTKGCTGYAIKEGTLFLASYSDKCTKLPYTMNLEQTIEFAWGWFQHNQEPKEAEPCGDGSTRVAFEISTEPCGAGSDDWGLFLAIKPIWFYYGK